MLGFGVSKLINFMQSGKYPVKMFQTMSAFRNR